MSLNATDRVLGCIVGGAIGDALGSAYEGRCPPIEIDDTSNWRLTDDTQLTLATCEAITEACEVSPQSIAEQMTDWFRQRRLVGLGASTLKALSELSMGGHWALSGRKGEMAAGNGPAARIAPLAFWLNPLDTVARQTIRDVAFITHHSDEAYVAALAVLSAVRAAWTIEWTGGTGLIHKVLPLLSDTLVRDRLMEFGQLNMDVPLIELARKYGNSGYAVESVPLALFAAQRVAAQGLKGVLWEIVSAGGDTDTIAAITGQIAGAAMGYQALPEDLVMKVPSLEDITSVATEFAEALQL